MIEDIYTRITQDEKLSREVKKSQEAFAQKPFVQEFLNLKQFSSIAKPIFSLFSIITGFSFLYFHFKDYIIIQLAALMALLILLIVEIAKDRLGSLACRQLYQRSRMTGALIVFALLFTSASVFLSVQGAKELYLQLNTEKASLEDTFQTKTDSINQYYSQALDKVEKSKANFIASVSWRGKINIANPNVSSTLNSFTAREDSLRSDLRQTKLALANLKDQSLAHAEAKAGFDLRFWFSASLLNETLILLSIWFQVFFAYRVSREQTLFEGQTSSEVSVTIQDFQVMAQQLNRQAQYLSQHAQSVPVGFNFSKAESLENSRENQEKGALNNSDFQGLRSAIAAGERDRRTLCKSYRVNVPTVNKEIKKFESSNEDHQQ